MTPLTPETFAHGLRTLSRKDPELASILARHGVPPMWEREPGFATLLHIILEQQVSLASARAAFRRVSELAAPLTPHSFLGLQTDALKAAGFSRQKIVYGRCLAEAIAGATLDMEALSGMSDEAVKEELVKVKGIGQWTADIYLLMALGRSDAWPRGDLALAVAAQEVKGLPSRPTPDELEALGARWRPWRAIAARLLWHHYLQRPARRHTAARSAPQTL